MPRTFSVSVDLDASSGTITISEPTPKTTVQSGDDVVWTVKNAEHWELTVQFLGGATMRSSEIRDEPITGAVHDVRRTIRAPHGTGSYQDDYKVILKGNRTFNSEVEITGTSHLVIERNVTPPDGRPPGGRGHSDPQGGAGNPGSH